MTAAPTRTATAGPHAAPTLTRTATTTRRVGTSAADNEAFTTIVITALARRLTEAVTPGSALADIFGPPEDLAARLVAVVTAVSPWADTVGPVYRQASLAHARGCSRQAIADLIRKKRLLTLTTSDNQVVIPAFQLDTRLRPLHGLAPVLALLTPDVVDPWTLASWLQAPQPALGRHSIIGHLAAGGDPAPVLELAHAVHQRWSS